MADIETVLNQLIAGDPVLVEQLQARDAELAKQEEDIRQQRQRIRAVLAQFASADKISLQPVSFVSPTQRDVMVLGCREGTNEAKIANLLADYLITKSESTFTRTALRDWSKESGFNIPESTLCLMFQKWTKDGKIEQINKNGATITYQANGKLSAFLQQARQVA